MPKIRFRPHFPSGKWNLNPKVTNLRWATSPLGNTPCHVTQHLGCHKDRACSQLHLCLCPHIDRANGYEFPDSTPWHGSLRAPIPNVNHSQLFLSKDQARWVTQYVRRDQLCPASTQPWHPSAQACSSSAASLWAQLELGRFSPNQDLFSPNPSSCNGKLISAWSGLF